MDVRLPDGRVIQGVPDGTTRDQLAQKLQANGMQVPQEWMAPAQPEQPPQPAATTRDRVSAIGSGFNRGIASVAGIPTDLGLNIFDLIKAGIGVTYSGVTGRAVPDSLAPTDRAGVVGSSEYIANLMNRSRVTNTQLSRPDDKASRYLYAGGAGAAGGALLGPATGAAMLPSAVSGTTSALASNAAAEGGGGPVAQTLAGIAGGAVPFAAQAGVNATRGAISRKAAQPPKPVPPTIEELTTAKNAAYKAAEDTGVVISRDALNRLKGNVFSDRKKEGIDSTLHPKATAAAKRILGTKGQLSLSEIETLRKIAGAAAGSIEKADARLGARIIEHIDDFEAGLTQSDVVGGSAAAGTAFREARALNTTLSKARVIQKIFDDAEVTAGANYTVSGMENALRQQFKALAKNDKRLRGFSQQEIAAIRKVAMGGPLENALRMIGKFAPNGVVSSMAGMGSVMVAGPAGMALPAAGVASKYAATKMTMKNAKNVENIVRSGK